MQPFFHCAFAATLLSVGAVLILDALLWLGLDQIDIFDANNEEELMQEDSATEEEEADSHPELGEGDLLPVRTELPFRVTTSRGRKKRSRRTKWNGELANRGVKRCGLVNGEVELVV